MAIKSRPMKSKTTEEIANEFHPTMNLRWVELKEWEEYSRVLEQQWVNNLGKVEWREIPTV